MRKAKKIVWKIIKIIFLIIIVLIVVILIAHTIGKSINNRTPEGGINESMYVDINGTKQWISIYGEDTENPVLLYLHGGPGSSTSAIDYAFTRKWADVYTVVTWDQRNCGKSYDATQNDITLTKEIFLTDGKEMTEFLLNYMKKDKITILGHSWGAYYGANLVLSYPELYDCFIGTGQLIDMEENEILFEGSARNWAEGNETDLALIDKLSTIKYSVEYWKIRNELMEKYGYGMMKDGTDYNIVTTVLFNPYYSILDWIKYLQTDPSVYMEFDNSSEFQSMSLEGRYHYEVPFYNINGEKDYQTNVTLAQQYFDNIDAPYKEMFIMEDTTHGLLESKSEEFSKYIHQIADNVRER